MEKLVLTRKLLVETLNHTESLSSGLEGSFDALRKLNSDLLESSQRLRSLHQQTTTLSALCRHAEHAVGPTSAVLTAHSSVVLLHRSLLESDPATDLPSYLVSTRRLEQALAFLTENCALAIRWINDVVVLLGEDSKAKRLVTILEEVNGTEAEARRPGGMISLAMGKLELELARIFEFKDKLPVSEGHLYPIVERLRSNGRGESVGRIYVEVRAEAVRSRILEGGVKLESPAHIAQWVRDVEFVVKKVVRFEYDMCNSLSAVSMDCYAKVVSQSGFINLLRFGNKVVGTAKKDAVKLLKLLQVFAALDGLRMDFNRLFGGRECVQVQEATRGVIKEVVEGAYEIFNELAVQVVEYSCPPLEEAGAGVPRLVTFVVDYCHLLLEDKYRLVLVQVLWIHRIWHQVDEKLIVVRVIREELCKVLEALEVNLDKWSKSLDDPVLACFFLMNNYFYLYAGLKGTKFGDLMGEEWLGGYYDKMEYYQGAYVEQSWGKLSSILTSYEDDVHVSVKRRLREFNKTFDYLWERQSSWVIYDHNLRENASRVIMQAVVPAYKTYLHDYAFNPNCTNYVKYSTLYLEDLFTSIFQPNAQTKTAASKHSRRHKITRVTSVDCVGVGENQFPATPVM